MAFKDLAKKYENKLSRKIMEELEENMPKKVTPKEMEKIFENSYQEYMKAKVEPGEAIGLIAASSFGEPSTQMTLHSKHFGGASKIQLSSGLPRLIEIFDGRKELSTPTMEIIFNKKVSEKEVKQYARKIKETLLSEFVKEFELDLVNQEVKLHVNYDKLKSENFSLEDLTNMIIKNIKGIIVNSDEKHIFIKRKIKDEKIMDIYKLKDKLKNSFVSGIKKITDVVIIKENDEFKLITKGSNFKEILKLDFINSYNSTSNDIWQTYQTFGIEAAREIIINEIAKVINGQGLIIDVRHMMLIADAMCMTGTVKGITRYGIVLDKDSVISKAAFETPMKHLFNAAITGQKDQLKSIIENAMINQPIPMGTGMSKLVLKDQ